MRRLVWCLAWWALPAAAQDNVRWAQVTYLSGATVYVDAGTRRGVREATRLEVIRGGAIVATLVADFVSSTRAACSIVTSTTAPAVGDSVRFVGEVVVADSVVAQSPRRGTAPRRDVLRGRIGIRYVAVDPGGGRATWTQPAFDLRLDGHHLGGTPLGLVADVRAYRERRGASGRGAQASTRVYQGHMTWSQPNRPLRVTAGRQVAPAVSSLGIFDGLTVELGGPHLGAGAIAGAQPEAASFGVSGIVREYGAWVQARNAPGSSASWSMTLAGVGSYDHGNIDREYAYAQAIVTARKVSLFATQELDLNRGWKRDAEGTSATPTASFAMVRVAPIDAVSLNVGFDNRRSVRLYRDFVDPVTEFDDTFRQGSWAGASLTPGRHLRVNVDARRASGGTGNAGSADTYTASAALVRLTQLGVGVQVRGSRYDAPASAGTLTSGSVEVHPWNRVRIEAGGGARTDTQLAADGAIRRLTWREASVDAMIGRSLFVMLSAYQENGDVGASRQGYLAVSWRF